MSAFDAVVVGSGPNGLTAAATLAVDGRRVLVIEAADEIGGGTRSAELTVPGFVHDVCSAIHPLGAGSPAFAALGIGDWVHPEIAVSHPLDGGRSGAVFRDLDATVERLGDDGSRYRTLVSPLADDAETLVGMVLGPLGPPKDPVLLGRFGVAGLPSASMMAGAFATAEMRGLIAGMAAHAITPLTTPFTGALAELFFASAHAFGWPAARGGSQTIADSLASVVLDAGGAIETGRRVDSIDELPPAPIVVLDVMPFAALSIAGSRLFEQSVRRLVRWESGPGVFKIDWALDGPVPWADDTSGRAGTVHVGGSFDEVAAAEADVAAGRHPDAPFVLVAQQSIFDPSRAPEGKHTLWGYCHVPAGSDLDMTEAIERQIDRFAPGFRDRIIARHTFDTVGYERHNPNYVGGDIAGGAFRWQNAMRFGAARHYRIGDGVYLCSAATPPGAGVHGMNGYHAATAAMAATP